MKIKHQSSLLMNTWIDSHLFVCFHFFCIHLHVSFLASQNFWNTKQNFSRISFSKLSRWLRYSIKIFSAVNLRVITNSVPRVHFYCAQYICLSFTSADPRYVKKTCPTALVNVGLGEKKTSYSTFRHNLLQHLGEHSISIELLQAAWLLS